MIVLDTHVWVWWVMGDGRLSAVHRAEIDRHEASTIGIADVSLFEIAMLIARNRLSVGTAAED